MKPANKRGREEENVRGREEENERN